jgi:isocitrate dehydrogenase
VKQIKVGHIELTMITNRGIKVWPEGFSETFCTDHWRCRFKPTSGQHITPSEIIQLMSAALDHGLEVIKTENLYAFDGKPAYSLGQGQ